MSEELVTTRATLLAHIERDWQALHSLLDRLDMEQLTAIRNTDGWSIKDHIAHLAAWENSVVAFLTGKPRHESLGVSESLFLSEDLDAMNLVIFQAHHDEPLNQVRAEFHKTHIRLLELLAPLTDDDLKKPYRHYLPHEPGDGNWPAINTVYGNTAHHYRTHQNWIEMMLEMSSAKGRQTEGPQ